MITFKASMQILHRTALDKTLKSDIKALFFSYVQLGGSSFYKTFVLVFCAPMSYVSGAEGMHRAYAFLAINTVAV